MYPTDGSHPICRECIRICSRTHPLSRSSSLSRTHTHTHKHTHTQASGGAECRKPYVVSASESTHAHTPYLCLSLSLSHTHTHINTHTHTRRQVVERNAESPMSPAHHNRKPGGYRHCFGDEGCVGTQRPQCLNPTQLWESALNISIIRHSCTVNTLIPTDSSINSHLLICMKICI